jgi:hypothetical protein
LADKLRPQDIEVERNESGIFAYIGIFSQGKNGKVTIWSMAGAQADEFRDKSDEEIQRIAFERWKLMETSRLRRKKQ